MHALKLHTQEKNPANSTAMIVEVGCQVGERQHCYAHCSSYLLMQGLRNCVDYVFYFVGIVGGEGGDGHLF